MKAHCSNPEMTGGEAISVPLIDEKVRMLEAIEVVGHHLDTTVPLRIADMDRKFITVERVDLDPTLLVGLDEDCFPCDVVVNRNFCSRNWVY